MASPRPIVVRALLLALLVPLSASAEPRYDFPHASKETVASRFAPPEGFTRVTVAPGSFGEWLRGLPLLPGRPDVRLYDGTLKANQAAHAAVLDVDVGARDLQQCADFVMRLRAEYLFASRRADEVCFRFTSGDAFPFRRYREGARATVKGKGVVFTAKAAPDASHAAFRRYLDDVFLYAGTSSLAKELTPVARVEDVAPGDVFLQPGFPGHAVIVVDVAERKDGARLMLLAQSYMPAQQPHVLANPAREDAWYEAKSAPKLETPEWTFEGAALRRFGASCATGR